MTPPSLRAWPVREGALVVVPALLFEAFLLLSPGSRHVLGVTDNLVLALGAGFAAVACWNRGGREGGTTGRGWRSLALAAGLFSVSEVGWAAHFLPSASTPVPGGTFLDLVVTPVYPLQLVGLLLLAGLTTVQHRVISFLDALLLGVSFVFLSWVVLVGPAYRVSVLSGVSETSLLYFMVGSLAVAALVLALALQWHGDRPTIWLLLGAFGWLGLTQVVFGEVAIRGDYRTGDVLLDVGWFAPMLLLALAARRPAVRPPSELARESWLVSLGLPYLGAVLAGVAVGWLLVTGQRFDRLDRTAVFSLIPLLVVRQLLTLVENRRLTTALEERVAERTRAVLRSEARLESILRTSPDVIALVDLDGRLTYVSPAAAQVLEGGPELLVGMSFLDLVHPADRSRTARALEECAQRREPGTLSCRVRRGAEGWRSTEATVSLMEENGSASQLVLNIRDVTERLALQDQMAHQAFHDALTGLPNRALFHERLQHALARAMRSGEDLAVLYLDLDHFKRVNDTSGHAVGDALLVAVAERLESCLRPSDSAARLGGDEFAVLLEGTSDEEAGEVAARLVSALDEPFDLGGRHVVVSASVGVRTCAGGMDSDTVLLRDADVAMYEAKAAGRARATPFRQHMYERLVEESELEQALREAVEGRCLEVFYQPVVNLGTGALLGVEALVRWQNGGAGWVPPSLFVPLAEQRGLIGVLDRWVLVKACNQVAEWQRRYPQHARLAVSVNVSATGLQDPLLARQVDSALEASGLQPGRLTLEITETAVLPDPPAVAAVLAGLRRHGIRVSLDDFGTGYSSLSSLRSVPLDEIKIDRSFVDRIDSTQSHRQVVQFLVALAQSMGLHTVAEAIETPEQLGMLRTLSCDAGQGYLFSPPLAAVDLEAQLAAQGTVAGWVTS